MKFIFEHCSELENEKTIHIFYKIFIIFFNTNVDKNIKVNFNHAMNWNWSKLNNITGFWFYINNILYEGEGGRSIIKQKYQLDVSVGNTFQFFLVYQSTWIVVYVCEKLCTDTIQLC